MWQTDKISFIGRKYEDVKQQIQDFFKTSNIRVLAKDTTITLEYVLGRIDIWINKDSYITDIWEG